MYSTLDDNYELFVNKHKKHQTSQGIFLMLTTVCEKIVTLKLPLKCKTEKLLHDQMIFTPILYPICLQTKVFLPSAFAQNSSIHARSLLPHCTMF